MEHTLCTAMFHLEFVTAMGYGGCHRVVLFHQRVSLELTLRDMLAWRETSLIHIPDVANINPTAIHQIDGSTFSAVGVLQLQKSSDSLEYYQELVSKGWIPNTQATEVARSLGYTHFQPSKL